MVEIIKTRRLEIKPIVNEDREKLSELLVNEQIKKTFIIPDFPNQEALDKMINAFIELSFSNEHFTRGIYSNGELIGFVNDVEIESDCIELGYVIHPSNWGKGVATEMLNSVINELFDKQFSIIKAGAFCDNIASIRVMEKCGMKKCPQMKNIQYRGINHSCVYYEIKS